MNGRRWRNLALIGLSAVAALALVVGVLGVLGAVDRADEPTARSSEDLVWLRKEIVTVDATGGAGAASGSASSDRDLNGYVYAVHVDYTAGISSTTDLTLTQASPALTMLLLSNYYTDTWYYPVVQRHGSMGSAVTSYEKALVADALDVAAGQTTSGTVAVVTVYWGQ